VESGSIPQPGDELMAQADRLEMSPGQIVRESVDFFLEKFVRFMEAPGPRELVQ
jgi:hypothetical protein